MSYFSFLTFLAGLSTAAAGLCFLFSPLDGAVDDLVDGESADLDLMAADGDLLEALPFLLPAKVKVEVSLDFSNSSYNTENRFFFT